MKTLILDTLAGLVFLAVLLATGSMAAAILTAAAVGLGQIGWLAARRRPVPAVQALGFGLIVVLGGASLATRDPRFVMLKPSLIQACLGGAMLRPGWMRRYLSPRTLERVPPGAVTAAGYAYAGTMFLLASANLAVAFTQGPVAWAAYSAAAPAIVFSLLGAGLYLAFRALARRDGVISETVAP
jgi:intracellular septation protein A